MDRYYDTLNISKFTSLTRLCDLLYEMPINRDWVASFFFPIQILLILSGHCNRNTRDTRLNIYRLPKCYMIVQFLRKLLFKTEEKAYFLSAVQLSDYKQPLIGQVNIGQFWFKSANLIMVIELSGVQFGLKSYA